MGTILSFADTVDPQGHKFAMGVKVEATGASKLNNSPEPEEIFTMYT